MLPEYITKAKLRQFINRALAEDVGTGDYTSLASVPANATGAARLNFKQDGIVAGLEMAGYIFKQVDKDLKIEYFKSDGNEIRKGETGFIVNGPVLSILKSERLVLNCMQRMSGVATLTNDYINQIRHTRARLLDTRKTTPNFRMMEKWAVNIAGGHNHRFGLYDMILLKDNHVDYCGGIKNAIQNTVKYLQKNNLDLKIEIETRNLDEVREAVETGYIHRILLDNMLASTLSDAVRIINGQYLTEASGGININSIKSIAETGVDFISVGQLTHSYKSLDMSLKAI